MNLGIAILFISSATFIGVLAAVFLVILIAQKIIRKIRHSSNGHNQSRKLLSLSIASAIVSVTLLASTIFVGSSFFNNPQFVIGDTGKAVDFSNSVAVSALSDEEANLIKIKTNPIPYLIERITLGVSGVITIILWVTYLSKQKG